MNLIIPGLILAVILYLIARKLLITLIIGIFQYMSHTIVSKLRLNVMPLISIDFEVSNIITILVATFAGFGYAFMVIFLNIAIHLSHEEVVDFSGMIDYFIKASILVIVVAFMTAPLTVTIPIAILLSKGYGIAKNLLNFSPVDFISSTTKDVFAIILYFAVFGLL